MAKTVIAMYGDPQTANAVVSDLTNANFKRSDITVMANNSSGGLDSVTDASSRALTNMGASQEQARMYMDSVKQGNILIATKVSDHETSQAQSIMEHYGIIDIGQGRQQPMAQSSSASGTSRTGQSSTRQSSKSSRNSDEETFEVVQEEIQVGKRPVETGGVRISSYVHEIPVEEEVRLREEHVQVERRPVNRPATPEELNNLGEKNNRGARNAGTTRYRKGSTGCRGSSHQ